MSQIYEAMRERYPAPAWALFYEVANGTGLHGRRYADAIAISLYPSRGLDVLGFEVKTDRSDWVRELKNPDKADEIASYCDFWFLVISDKEIVKDGEVPSAWGVLTMQGESLRQIKKAEKLKPKPLDRVFVAALLRRAHESATKMVESGKAIEQSYQRGKKQGEEDAKTDVERAQRELKHFQKSVDDFEKKSGIKINSWNGGDLGDSIEMIRNIRRMTPAQQVEEIARHLELTAEELRRRVEIAKSIKEGV
jgi:hypothetical protein